VIFLFLEPPEGFTVSSEDRWNTASSRTGMPNASIAGRFLVDIRPIRKLHVKSKNSLVI
jgi:hypothetical protein